jgi:hypothetical protein
MRRWWPAVPLSAVPVTVVLAAVLVAQPGAAQVPGQPGLGQVSPGWYVIPSFSLSEEYDSNVSGTSSRKESDFVTRIAPGVTFGYQSVPLTLLLSYAFGAELYASNSDLNGVNRHAASLDFRYLPNPRLVVSLGAAYVRSESLTGQIVFLPGPSASTAPGEPAPGAPAAGAVEPGAPAATPSPTIPGVETGRRTTSQYIVAPTVSYQFDPLTSGRAGYAYNRSEVEGSPADQSHSLTLAAERRLTPRDTGSVQYTARYFDTEADAGDASDSQSDTLTSHAFLLGYSRRLTEQASASLAAGPRITDEGDVGGEARASITYRLRSVDLGLGYARTQGIVTGRQGAQTVDTVTGSVRWVLTRELVATLDPRVSFISADDESREDTTVYAVAAGLEYRINLWLSARAQYLFTHQDERGGDDITRHVLTLGLVATYPYRIY